MQVDCSSQCGQLCEAQHLGQLILVRHCETQSNVEGTVQGRQNSSLTKRGRLQAELVGEYVSEKFEINRVISSDRRRCLETASTIGAEVITTSLLRELDFGDWEGQKWSKITSDQPADIENMLASDPDFRPPNGESLTDMDSRLSSLIDYYGLLDITDIVAIVSHDGTLRSLISKLVNWKQENISNLVLFVGSVTTISTGSDSPKIELLNYYQHLTPTYEESTPN